MGYMESLGIRIENSNFLLNRAIVALGDRDMEFSLIVRCPMSCLASSIVRSVASVFLYIAAFHAVFDDLGNRLTGPLKLHPCS